MSIIYIHLLILKRLPKIQFRPPLFDDENTQKIILAIDSLGSIDRYSYPYTHR
jgi:hypothetical protein